MVKTKVAVVGAGLGGMSAALRLSALGCDVSVFEKNEFVGGKAGEYFFDGFRFDSGPSLITMPFVLEDLFESVGLKMNDYFELKQLDVVCKYFYPDSTQISAYSNVDKFGEEIEKHTLDRSADVKKYLNHCKRIYDLSADLFLFKSFSEKKNFFSLKAVKTLLNLKSLDTHRTMHKANASFFKDKKTIQLFDRYATYNGSNPYKAPATLNIIQHVEYNLGAFISGQGIYSIPQAVKKAGEKKGVKYFKNANVTKINHTAGRVSGIEVNGKLMNFDIVVSNSDVENTYRNLLKDDSSRDSRKYYDLEKSTSAVVFYWGVKELHPALEIHNILFSENYSLEFDQLFNLNIMPADPTVYIYISSKFRKEDAPANCENWFVMVNAPHNKGHNWEKEISVLRPKILNKIKSVLGIDLENKIISEKVLTPQVIEDRTSSVGGSIYGIASNKKMSAFMRQQNKSKMYRGLYFCGGSAHPGGGIPLVILSGKIVSELIYKYELS